MTNLFINHIQTNPFYYLAVVLTIVVSIVLHELAHGWMAIRLGDHTPIELGRMTGNPFIHMGGLSIFIMLVFGIAWGQMPIDPTRMRGKYAEALVAVAGPLTNLILSVLAMTGLIVWMRVGTIDPGNHVHTNAVLMLWVFGFYNMVLCLFNLFPIPPLDGSHILANMNNKYANFIGNQNNQMIMMFGFFLIFSVAGVLFSKVAEQMIKLLFILSGENGGVLMQIIYSRLSG